MPHRIVVAADISIIRTGIISMLARDPQLQVIADVEDGAQAVAACQRLRPDLLILALWLQRSADLAVMHLLATDRLAPRVLVLGEAVDAALVYAAMKAGAAGFLPATAGDAELCAGVHRVLAGELLLPDLGDDAAVPRPTLGTQERLILQQVAEGLPNKAIARQLHISVRTVGSHLHHIFRKLGVTNRMEAVLRARQLGLLQNE
jgi:DNA-binding NarL/FixJ family response regulator